MPKRAWLYRGHQWEVIVQDPLKSLVMGPSLLKHNEFLKKNQFVAKKQFVNLYSTGLYDIDLGPMSKM